MPGSRTGLWPAVLILSACGADERLYLPTPELAPDTATIFYAVVGEHGAPQVFAYSSQEAIVVVELDEAIAEGGAIYAISDVHSLEAHGLGAGPVAPVADGTGRSLSPSSVHFRALDGEDAKWTAGSLPRVLTEFRFSSAVPSTRCVSLEHRARHEDLDFSPAPDSGTTLLALDDARVLAFYLGQPHAVVLTATSATRFDLGFDARVRSHRALFLAPSGDIYLGGADGRVRRGRPGQAWSEVETISVPAPIGQEARWPYYGALSGGLAADGTLELYAVTDGYVSRILPTPSLIYERGDDLSSRSYGTLAWLAPRDILFSLQDSGRAFRHRPSGLQVVLPASEVSGMENVDGLGVFAVTSTLQLLEWIREDESFRQITADVSGRDVSIAGNAERLFTLGEEGQLDQFVPGEGQCPALGFVPREKPTVAVFGRWLALTVGGAVEIYEMVPSR